MVEKSDIRQKIRVARQQMPREEAAQLSDQIAEKVITLPVFLESQHIGFYAAQENEVDLSTIFHTALNAHKSLYLPVFSKPHNLSFYKIDRKTVYAKNKFGIDEPVISHQAPIDPHKLDLIFMPLVAFDARGSRVGRGAGCYDRYLHFKLKNPKARPVLIGLAYAFQLCEAITPDSWDVPMDYIVTEKEIISSVKNNQQPP